MRDATGSDLTEADLSDAERAMVQRTHEGARNCGRDGGDPGPDLPAPWSAPLGPDSRALGIDRACRASRGWKPWPDTVRTASRSSARLRRNTSRAKACTDLEAARPVAQPDPDLDSEV